MRQLIIAAITLLTITTASADTYVLVIRDGSATAPDLAQYHATIVPNASWGPTRQVVTMPPTDATLLRQHPRVRYLQRVAAYDGSSPSARRVISDESLMTPEVLSAPPDWTTGTYQYDASGDLRAIDSDSALTNHRYIYDDLARLLTASVQDIATPGVDKGYFHYSYDGFGNRLSRNDQHNNVLQTPATAATNRLRDQRYAYNSIGALITDDSHSFKYDAAAMLAETDINGTLATFAIYTVDDERLALCSGSACKWTIRGGGQKVRRELESNTLLTTQTPAHWLWIEDYVYRGDSALSGQREDREGGRMHFHQDNLGSTRLVTGSGGQQIAAFDFEPFGTEILPVTYETQNLHFERNEPIRFTGHQRDFQGPNYTDGDPYLDYMHARYYNPFWGRFLSVDSGDTRSLDLQSWNRYTYARNRPLNNTDPDGHCPTPEACKAGQALMDAGTKQMSDATIIKAEADLVNVSVPGTPIEGKAGAEINFKTGVTSLNGSFSAAAKSSLSADMTLVDPQRGFAPDLPSVSANLGPISAQHGGDVSVSHRGSSVAVDQNGAASASGGLSFHVAGFGINLAPNNVSISFAGITLGKDAVKQVTGLFQAYAGMKKVYDIPSLGQLLAPEPPKEVKDHLNKRDPP